MPAIRNNLLGWLFLAVLPANAPAAPVAPVQSCRIIAKYPHSTENYTEGFFYLDGLFYEGTGRTARSAVIATEPETGKVVLRHDLPPEYFGEGIVEWTPTSSELVTSDGSATLRFRDPNTFQETRHITVKEGDHEIKNLNELEFIKGEIYANVWHSDRIARISPDDGHIIAWIDLTGLFPTDQRVDSESVLNGIGYDAKKDRLFVTGKQWPAIYEIKIVSWPTGKTHPTRH
jgi:glutamine cyclotransferase